MSQKSSYLTKESCQNCSALLIKCVRQLKITTQTHRSRFKHVLHDNLGCYLELYRIKKQQQNENGDFFPSKESTLCLLYLLN